jgi:acyl-homoserine-lactone acylase
VAAGVPAGATPAGAVPVARAAVRPVYQAKIMRTAYGIPHITASGFGSLGYGYGFALASDDLCAMAGDYVTVEGQRSRYFGPNGTYDPLLSPVSNLDSDIFWRSVIASREIPRLLARRSGPDAIGPQLRALISGYVAGYNHYLASVGGPGGVPDPTCRGKPWVQPITTLDAYLRIYQFVDQNGQAANITEIARAQPPAATAQPPAASSAAVRHPAAGLARQAPGLGPLLSAAGRPDGAGSNAIAVGSAGARDHQHGLLLGNPHYVWAGANRFYQVQLTIPGVLNVEGATMLGIPPVLIGFTRTAAWSLTISHAFTAIPYQLTLVQGHPTQYLVDGKQVAMTSHRVTVWARSAGGTVRPVRHTVWYTRYGPVFHSWTTTTAFAIADANAVNFRFLSQVLAIDQARSVPQLLSALRTYEGLPFFNTLAADATGHAMYADIQAIPDVTDAKLARCNTPLGKSSFASGGPPILDGTRSSCGWGTGRRAAAPGILGPGQEPILMRRDFTENSNDSYWMTSPANPLTGFPDIIGDDGTGLTGAVGADLGLRTRSALAMISARLQGTDGAGPPGFTFAALKHLMYSDIQYGATLVKRQLVAMCHSFPGGLAPTATGTIPVGDSCRVLAAWSGTENPGSRGAVLFRLFWEAALALPGGPWSHPFQATDPLHTPNGLNTASPQVQQAFGNALAALHAAHLPYDVPLSAVQYLTIHGKPIPLPGGPGDPDGQFNAIYQSGAPGSLPSFGTSYIQAVTWKTGDPCPQAATLLTYSESANPASPHFADQTELFSHRGWVTASFCPAQVAAHALSTTLLRGR